MNTRFFFVLYYQRLLLCPVFNNNATAVGGGSGGSDGDGVGCIIFGSGCTTFTVISMVLLRLLIFCYGISSIAIFVFVFNVGIFSDGIVGR